MSPGDRSAIVLVADDDLDDCSLLRDALAEGGLAAEARFVHDGEELLQYLRREGPYADPAASPWPALVLLDLNMPRKDGREALQEIRQDPALRVIPVVILTTSQAQEDVTRAYEVGANSYVTKPATFSGLVELVQGLGRYWLQTVKLPQRTTRD